MTLQQIKGEFISDYQDLSLPGLRLSYVENLENIGNPIALAEQTLTFARLQNNLAQINRTELSETEQLEYDLLKYHLELNLERLQLEYAWAEARPEVIPTDGLMSLPNGKDWYAYFLKVWIDKEVTPEAMFDFGLAEVTRVKQQMKKLQQSSGMDSMSFQQYIRGEQFFYNSPQEVQRAFEQIKADLEPELVRHFPALAKVRDHQIAQGTSIGAVQVPAYYRNNTFFYNYFDKPFNKRQVVWIYLHEAVPGHHYETHYSPTVEVSDFQRLFWVPCYAEGWAAYVEEIGNEIGAYRSIYDELGKWEWDIIRSVRVPLDVGLNYYGWSDEKAMNFWQKHIVGKDDIARREINRMKNWPCQVITYKYGAQKILEWKAAWEQERGRDLHAFHKAVLGRGHLPVSLLDQLMKSHK